MLEGSGWELVYPIGGYPDMITNVGSGGPFNYGTECYSSDFDWTHSTVILPDCGFGDHVRFRFGSDQGVGEEGWYLDDFRIYYGEGLIGIQDEEVIKAPQDFALYTPYPNPFNSSTVLTYSLPYNTEIKLDLIDVSGRKVMTLIDGMRSAGEHSFAVSGALLSSGIYFAVLQTPDKRMVQKLMYLK